MAKANITESRNIKIKGVLNVDESENHVIVEVEDGETYELGALLAKYNNSEVAISVGESIEIA